MMRALRLEGIITTVDALFAGEQISRFTETRKQIALADAIVITKSDLVDADHLRRVEAQVRRLNSGAPIVRADHGAVAARELLPASFVDRTASPSVMAPARSRFFAEAVAGDAGHVQDIVAVALECTEPLAWPAFEAWLKAIRLGHAEKLLRVKGMIYIEGVAGPVVVHGVHHVLHPPVVLDHWPAAGPETRLILIVEAAIAPEVRASWHRAFLGMMVTADGAGG